MRRLRAALALALAAIAGAAVAAPPPLALEGTIEQGGLVIGRTVAGAAVRLDGEPVPVAADGTFLLGFGRDAPAAAELEVSAAGGRVARRLEVRQRTYQVQRIEGLPPAVVTPPPEVIRRIEREAAQVAAARAGIDPVPRFGSGFAWPATGPISGVYGSQRILNGEPRRPHFGVDVAVPVGTPVAAAADGRVVLAEPDLYFTGGTVIVEHGLGLTTDYFHMSKVEVRVGELVSKGQKLGEAGATGRATGPHLHWGMVWKGRRLDPALVVPPMVAAD